MITAVVSNGNLLIELEDGSIINAGRVQGPAGRDGAAGAEGPRGSAGISGRDGQDGASIRTGFGAPNPDLYSDGDLYIDVQSANLSLYQKIAGDWASLGSMKGQPGPPGLPGTDGSSEAEDWGAIISPNNPPAVDNSGEPIQNGDIWFDTTTGYIYVRTDDGWIPVSDNPPVTVSADPPAFNPSSDPTNPNKRYPVKVGDLWFDSDQLALYTAVENVDGDLVWIIATPTDRTGVIDEVPSTFVAPAAADKDTAKNDATGVEYIYNAAKNQWIDFTTSVCIDYDETPPEPKCTGHLWFDNSDDQLTLYIYNGEFWIPAAPPVSLEGIKNTIDAALEVQNSILERLDSGEAAQATIQGTIDGALTVQGNLLDAVNTLENKVDALEGTVIDGQWILDNRSIARAGHFIPFTGVTQSLTWDGTDGLQLHPEGNDGRTYTFQEVSIDDVIRIGASGSSALFKVTSAPVQSGDVYNIGVTLLSSSGVPAEMLLFDFEFLPSFDPSNYATKDYVDAQDDLSVKLVGENFITPSWSIKSNAKSFISITSNEMKLYNIADPTGRDDGWAANKGYVDTQIADIDIPDLSGYLTGNGTQILDAAKWRLQQPDSGNTNRNFIEIEDNNMKLFHVQDPTDGSAEWAANKGYVDLRVKKIGDAMSGRLDIEMETDTAAAIRTIGTINVKANGETIGGANNFVAHKDYVRVWSTPSDPKDVATKAYVDENAGGPPVPAKWAWIYKGETSDSRRDSLAAGQFIGPVLGTSSGSYSPYYYFHLRPNNSSYRINQRTYDEEIVFNTPDGAPLISIWYVGGSTSGDYLDGKVVHMSSQRVKRYKIAKDGSSAGDGPFFMVECHNGSQYGNHFHSSSLAVDRIYYATLAGIF